MTAPAPKSREEWEASLDELLSCREYGALSKEARLTESLIDSIMALQSTANAYASEICTLNNRIEEIDRTYDFQRDTDAKKIEALQSDVERVKAEVVSTDALADSLRFRLEEANKLLSRDTDLLSIKISIKAYLESYNNWISCNCSVQYENELIEFANEKRRVLFGIVGMTEKHVTSDDEIEKARQPK